jgi:S-adenosylmethionine synthetase
MLVTEDYMARFSDVSGESSFTSESVTAGHPDKVADGISDAVLDQAVAGDPEARVACEVLVSTGLIVVSGEMTTKSTVDVPTVARQQIASVGYTDPATGFAADSCAVMVAMNEQSADIAQGVNAAQEVREFASEDDSDLAGAGDQGMMFGYACMETTELMPLPISTAHKLARRLSEVRESGQLGYLYPDGKTQVTVRYSDGVPVAIEKVVVSAHHADWAQSQQIREDIWELVVKPTLPEGMYDEGKLYSLDNYLVNPTGRFVKGGPAADAGLTGRKIIVDTYGGMARHGGGAFSGKDPSKVDRSAAYVARYVAKNVVAAGLAERAELQIAYAIGRAAPVSMMVETFGTAKIPEVRIISLVNEMFDLRPAAFRKELRLHRPIYRKTSAYGHFGRDDEDFTWEQTDRAAALAEAAGVAMSEVVPA